MNRLPVMIRLVLPALAVLLSGCLGPRLSDFTEEARRSYQLTNDELQRIQFYNSHTIIFTAVEEVREPPPPKRRRKQPLDTRQVNRVVIKRRTRGIVVAVGSNWLDVSFEEGKWLRFTRLPSGRYTLKAAPVIYGGQRYRVECQPRRFS